MISTEWYLSKFWTGLSPVSITENEISQTIFKEERDMTSKNSSQMEVPQAKEAMDKFKMEVAGELGVPLKNGYNGDLTSAQNGSVGGEMVRRMIKRQEQEMAGK